MEKNFKALIEEIVTQAKVFEINNKKLRDCIMQIFYQDDLIGGPENPDKGIPPIGSWDTVENSFKEAIGLIRKQNQEYEKLLQIIQGWLR